MSAPNPGGIDTGALEGFTAAISLHVGSMREMSDQLAGWRRELAAKVPTWAQKRQGATGASGLVVIGLGGPELGHIWHVRSLRIGGINRLTAAAGSADVYVVPSSLSAMIATGYVPGLDMWRDYTAALPNVAFYGRGELVVHPHEHVDLVLSGSTAGQSYIAAASIEQFAEPYEGN